MLRIEDHKLDDSLANIIIDEITHIQTQSNHGTNKYDKKFGENLTLYYLNEIQRLSLKYVIKNNKITLEKI